MGLISKMVQVWACDICKEAKTIIADIEVKGRGISIQKEFQKMEVCSSCINAGEKLVRSLR